MAITLDGSGLTIEKLVRIARHGEKEALSWIDAALHDTTTDEVAIFDRGRIPASHSADLQQLDAHLAAASQLARAERAVAEALRLLEDRVAPLATEPAPPVRYRRPGGSAGWRRHDQ